MKVLLLQACICVAVLATLSEANPNSVLLQRNRRAKLCGRMLSQALSMVCESNYYSPQTESPRLQRSYLRPLLFKEDNFWISRPDLKKSDRHRSEMVFMGRKLPLLPPTPRNDDHFSRLSRKGVVEECCHKSCSITELRSYCGSKSKSQEEQADEQTDEVNDVETEEK